MAEFIRCRICRKFVPIGKSMEYRGAYSCEDHLDEMAAERDLERRVAMNEENAKFDIFKGLDLAEDSPIGRANRRLLSRQIDIASRQWYRMRAYDEGDKIYSEEEVKELKKTEDIARSS